jgi:V8-like Glu-specific endopeptidase
MHALFGSIVLAAAIAQSESVAAAAAIRPSQGREPVAAGQPPQKQKQPPQREPAKPVPPPICLGDYADALPAEAASHILDAKGDSFVFAIRNIATYEHVYYGRDGKLRKAYLRSVVHGTGFAIKALAGETFLVTNEHVASRPEVTDDEHGVQGIPPGSKKVREQLKIVHDESDDYEPGHIALSRVLSDPAADIAMLKAKKMLPVMPYHLGRSSALRSGNLVTVRGFPLGVFAALNSGKVVNPYTQDTEKAWQHTDFVIDALLSGGNSGSPVFAISCRTGEPELVGVYHAGFTDAAALNVVVGIDQLREELETFKVPHRDAALMNEITAADRDRVVQELFADQTHKLIFPYGARTVQAELTDPETLRFAVLDEDFPLATREALALVDRARNGFGTLDAVGLSSDDGQLSEVPAAALDADARDHLERLYDSLWHQLIGVLEYRAAQSKQRLSADAYAEAQAARVRLRRKVGEQKELLGLAFFDTDKPGVGGVRMAAAPDAGVPGSADAGIAGTGSAPPANAGGSPAAPPAGTQVAAPRQVQTEGARE